MSDPWEDFQNPTIPSGENGPWDDFQPTESAKPNPLISSAKSAVGSGIKALGTVASDIGLPALGQPIQEYGQGVVDRNPAQIRSLGDIAEHPLTALQEGIGNAAGSIPASVAGAWAGAKAGAALPLPPQFRPIAGLIGAGVGAFAPNLIAEYGQIRDKQGEEGYTDKGQALSHAVGAAGLETLADVGIAGKLLPKPIRKLIPQGVGPLAEGAGVGARLAQAGKAGMIGAGVEGGTEAAQSMIERAGANQPINTPEAFQEAGMGAALGALGGGPIRGGIEFVSPTRAQPGENQPAPLPGNSPSALPSPGPLSQAADVAQANGATQPLGLPNLAGPNFITMPDGSVLPANEYPAYAKDQQEQRVQGQHPGRAGYTGVEPTPIGIPNLGPDPYIVMPDGTTMLRSEFDQHAAKLSKGERSALAQAIQRQHPGFARETALPEPQAKALPSLGQDPLIAMPDGSVMTRSEAIAFGKFKDRVAEARRGRETQMQHPGFPQETPRPTPLLALPNFGQDDFIVTISGISAPRSQWEQLQIAAAEQKRQDVVDHIQAGIAAWDAQRAKDIGRNIIEQRAKSYGNALPKPGPDFGAYQAIQDNGGLPPFSTIPQLGALQHARDSVRSPAQNVGATPGGEGGIAAGGGPAQVSVGGGRGGIDVGRTGGLGKRVPGAESPGAGVSGSSLTKPPKIYRLGVKTGLAQDAANRVVEQRAKAQPTHDWAVEPNPEKTGTFIVTGTPKQEPNATPSNNPAIVSNAPAAPSAQAGAPAGEPAADSLRTANTEAPNQANTEAQAFSPEQAVKLAADDITKLRKDDVYRVLNESGAHADKTARYIVKHRKDLDSEVSDVMREFGLWKGDQWRKTPRTAYANKLQGLLDAEGQATGEQGKTSSVTPTTSEVLNETQISNLPVSGPDVEGKKTGEPGGVMPEPVSAEHKDALSMNDIDVGDHISVGRHGRNGGFSGKVTKKGRSKVDIETGYMGSRVTLDGRPIHFGANVQILKPDGRFISNNQDAVSKLQEHLAKQQPETPNAQAIQQDQTGSDEGRQNGKRGSENRGSNIRGTGKDQESAVATGKGAEEGLEFEPHDKRLKSQRWKDWLLSMMRDVEIGGGVVIMADGRRSQSVNADWFQNMPQDVRYPVARIGTIINKAVSGEKLGPREQRLVSYLLDELSSQRSRLVESARQHRQDAREQRRDPWANEAKPFSEDAFAFDESEYADEMSDYGREIFELTTKLDAVGIDAAEIVESAIKEGLSDEEIVQRLERKLAGANSVGQVQGQQAQEPRTETPPVQQDGQGTLFGDVSGKQAIRDLELRKDAKRNGNERDIAAGDVDGEDLFNGSSKQQAIQTPPEKQPEEPPTPAAEEQLKGPETEKLSKTSNDDNLDNIHEAGDEAQALTRKGKEQPRKSKKLGLTPPPSVPDTGKDAVRQIQRYFKKREDIYSSIKLHDGYNPEIDVEIGARQSYSNPITTTLRMERSRDGVKWEVHQLQRNEPTDTNQSNWRDEAKRLADWLNGTPIEQEPHDQSQNQAEKTVASEEEAVAKSAKETIQDIGEKIGGARKDTAIKTEAISRSKNTEDERPAWARRYEISQVVSEGPSKGTWSIYDSKQTNWLKQPKQVGDGFATEQEAKNHLPIIEVARKHRVISGGKRSDGGYNYEIWRDINDRKRVKVVDRSFATRDEAMKYMADHAREIIETNTTFGEADLPTPDNTDRVGAERRTGDVQGEDFRRVFGFRGIEFGNWNNQSERQQVMNAAYDGLMDLADVLGVPPKAIGLNGDLALAFGARGQGLNSARAHYERNRAVINLTKMKGAGALAHEWFHALDHYLGRQDGKASNDWITHEDGTRTLKTKDREDDYVSHGFKRADSGVREELRTAYDAIIDTIFRKAEQYVEDTQKADTFVAKSREDVASQLDALRKNLSEQLDTRYYKRNNKPATAEQLAEFDTIAQQFLAGELLETEYRYNQLSEREKERARHGRLSLSGRWSNDALDKISAIYKAVRGRSGFDSTNQNGVMDSLRQAMNRYSQRLKMLAEAQKGDEKTRKVPTEFAMDAKSLDQGRGENYWTTPHEMAARAFQGYVEDKFSGKTPFLNYAPENVVIPTPWGWKRPYPHGAERKAINKAFDDFVSVIKTKETETGTALYSKHALPVRDTQGDTHELAASVYDHAGKAYPGISEGRGTSSLRGYSITRQEADRLASEGVHVFRVATRGADTTGLQGWFVDNDHLNDIILDNARERLNYQTGQRIPWSEKTKALLDNIEASRDRVEITRPGPTIGQSTRATKLRITIHRGGENQPADLYSKTVGPNVKNPLTVQAVKDALTKQLGKPAQAWLDSGRLVIAKDAAEAARLTGNPDDLTGVKAFYAHDTRGGSGKIILVADALTPSTIKPVLLHEVFHSAWREDAKLAAKMDGLLKGLEIARTLGKAHPDTALGRWVAQAEQAVKSANTPAEHELEEFAAYALEQYERGTSLPARIVKFVKDLLAHIRAALAKLGYTPKYVSPADLSLLAKEWLRNGAREPVSGAYTFDGTTRYSGKRLPFKAKDVRDEQGHLLAPNGEPSKLNEVQWHQVRSPQFKAWFGDWENDPENASKVVDENGEPLVVYHGTNADIDTFSQPTRWLGEGLQPTGVFFFAEEPAVATAFAVSRKKLAGSGSANIVPVFLNIKNPSDLRGVREIKRIIEKAKLEAPQGMQEYHGYSLLENEETLSEIKKDNKDGALLIEKGFPFADYRAAHDYRYVDYIMSDLSGTRKYDANVFAVFSPSQIKSATGNTGSFSPTNPDIRYSKAGEALKKLADDFKADQRPIKERAKAAVDATQDFLSRISPLGTLPNKTEYLKARYLTQGQIADVDAMSRSLYESFKDAGEFAPNIYEFLTTAEASPGIIKDAGYRKKAIDTKRLILEVGQKLVDRGLISEDTYEANKGAYLPQLYLRSLLKDSEWVALGTGKRPSTMGYTKGRKLAWELDTDGKVHLRDKETGEALPDDVALSLGPIVHPGYLAAKGYGTQMRDVALLDWLAQISKHDEWILPKSLVEFNGKRMTPFFLKAEAARIMDQAAYYDEADRTKAMELAMRMNKAATEALNGLDFEHTEFKQMPNTKRYGMLRGLIVRKEIYDDIVGATNISTGDMSVAEKLLGAGGLATRATQWWKWAKVAANPPSQVRNFVSNAVLLHLSGVPFHRVPQRIIEAIKDIRTNGEYWKVAKKYGVTESTFAVKELPRIDRELLDIKAQAAGKYSWAQVHKLFGRMVDWTGDIYQLSEAVFKTAKIMDEMKKGKSESDAALEAQKWLFDYSLVSPSVRYLRNAPIGAPFLTFATKALPRMLEVAVKHPLRFAPYMAIPFALTAIIAGMNDVDDDDVDKLKKALPEWLQKRGHAYLLPYKDENGRWQAMDFGYFFPWAQWTELASGLWRGDVGEAFSTSGLLGGPLVDLVSAAKTGIDPFTQKKIMDARDPAPKQAADLMGYLYRMAAPTWLTDIGAAGHLYRALNGYVDKYGEPKTTVGQAALRLGGVNLYPIDPTNTRAENIKRMRFEISDIKRRRTMLLKDRNLDIDERKEIVEEYQGLLQKRMTELQDYAKASEVHPKLR